ncbi:hypothetical protein PRZ48_011505 [Zasmidium cellare]|uniref:Uncharacterized protein n=1 Tax=Zasmidium cellare TaxID=395010 RepID=A0ABR0E6K1_ZASCE|nr:hypothetical protein PRZ48_011505 [Zasmidium cellare]
MAGRFYEHPSDSHHLKPMHLSSIRNHSSASLTSTFSANDYHHETYHAVPHSEEIRGLNNHNKRDSALKSHIRLLRLISRLLATLLSLATLIPLLITLTKFLQTRHVHFTVNGKQRTAWANDSLPWYTYMYTAIAAVSFLLNLVVVISYWKGVRSANKAAEVGSWWTWGVVGSHVVTWGVAAGVYRYGKSSSFYSGIANVVLGLLTLVITIMALVRMRGKKKRARREGAGDMEPLRG